MLAYVTCFLIFVLLVVVTVAAGLNFHWQCLFVIWTGSAVAKDPELIQQLTLDSINGFPTEMVEMVKNSDLESLSIARLRYRAPWDVLRGSFRKGTVAVVGDAMHVLGPFLGQVGSAAIEDAIVLARCFAQKMHGDGRSGHWAQSWRSRGWIRERTEDEIGLVVNTNLSRWFTSKKITMASEICM